MVYCNGCKVDRDSGTELRGSSDSDGDQKISAGGTQTLEKFEDLKSIPVEWPKSIGNLLRWYPCCPPDAFINVKQFYDNPFVNHLPDNHKSIGVALRNWSAKIRQWKLIDFVRYYHNPRVSPYFNVYARPIDDYYFDVETSVNITKQLLLYQFDNEPTLITKFLTDLYNIIDFIIPKFNSMCIESPPSAVKNFFFDAVAAFFLNYGMTGVAAIPHTVGDDDGLRSVRLLASELYFRYVDSPCVYISDICVPRSPDEHSRLLTQLKTGLQRCAAETQNLFKFIATHRDHVHIAHACFYSNKSCRCTWLQGSGIWRTRRRQRHRRRVFLSDFKVQDWESVLGYFAAEEYTTEYSESRSANGRNCLKTKDLQVRSKTSECRFLDFNIIRFVVVHRREDIRKLEKNQWYTRVHTKAIGTLNKTHPTMKKLTGVIGDLVADLKQKRNLRSEKTFVYGQKL